MKGATGRSSQGASKLDGKTQTYTVIRRRKWQPTLVFLPGESWGRGSLVGFHLWGCIESDTTEVT